MGLQGKDSEMKIFIMILLFLAIQSHAAQKPFCLDSDKGIQPKIKGKVSMRFSKSDLIVMDMDYCKSEQILIEQFCSDQGEPQQKEVECKCQNGACR